MRSGDFEKASIIMSSGHAFTTQESALYLFEGEGTTK
jgi:hypothetical protein